MILNTVLALAFGLGWVPMFLYRPEPHRAALRSYHGTERRWVQAAPVLMAAHVTASCVAINVAHNIPIWRAAIGLGVFAMALAFWFWGRALIGPLAERRLPDEPPRALRRDGAFGIVRHPLYASYLLAAAAPLWVVPRAGLFATYALCALGIVMRSLQEEQRLHAQLGSAYADYCRDVKRLVPFVW